MLMPSSPNADSDKPKGNTGPVGSVNECGTGELSVCFAGVGYASTLVDEPAKRATTGEGEAECAAERVSLVTDAVAVAIGADGPRARSLSRA